MPLPEQLTPVSPVGDKEKTPEIQPKVASFKTEMGSIYTYDDEGKTTRYKTATGEQMEQQDITVFAPMTGLEQAEFLEAYHLNNSGRTKVYILERQDDDSPKIIRDISEIRDPARIYLGILRDGAVIKTKQVSIEPIVGTNVFDMRSFEENGQRFTERHLGNRVTEVAYQ